MTDVSAQFRRDLTSGFPEYVVIKSAIAHLCALRKLPPSTPERAEAIASMLAFLKENPLDGVVFEETLETGMMVRDNDVRTSEGANRLRRIHAFDNKGRAVLCGIDSDTGETNVSVTRIFSDGKARKTGWSLI